MMITVRHDDGREASKTSMYVATRSPGSISSSNLAGGAVVLLVLRRQLLHHTLLVAL